MTSSSAASAKKIERQPKCSPSHPAAAVPNATPAICPTRKRASSGWRRSYATVSPIQASASGMKAPIVAPETKRAAISVSSDGAIAQAAEPNAETNAAAAMVR